MIPHYSTPVSDRLNAATRHADAITALKNLRTELHTHRVYPSIAYDEGQPRLVISTELTVWADRSGAVLCWGADFMEEPADHAPVDDLVKIAARIAGRLGKRYAEPANPS